MNITPYTAKIRHLDESSHKGQNGKVLLIGGSELFHSASRWALDVVSAMVDMVFYSSVPENNELIKEAKREFWDGVVVPREKVEDYLKEADVILIGPGMTRDLQTEEITNRLVSKYPEKKWVIDAGALQMIDVKLLQKNMILTPHQKELELLLTKANLDLTEHGAESVSQAMQNAGKGMVFSLAHKEVCILVKGETDVVIRGNKTEPVQGGNPGMTKGGTGDALAGLIAGLYCFSDDPFAVSVVGSYVNKKAGDNLYEKVGPFFKTSELVKEIPVVLKDVLQY